MVVRDRMVVGGGGGGYAGGHERVREGGKRDGAYAVGPCPLHGGGGGTVECTATGTVVEKRGESSARPRGGWGAIRCVRGGGLDRVREG